MLNLMDLRDVSDAHTLTCNICVKCSEELPRWAWIPIIGDKHWNAYRKVNRVAFYLFNRCNEEYLLLYTKSNQKVIN